MEDTDEVKLIDSAEAISAVAAVAPTDSGYDRGYAEGHKAGLIEGHAAGAREASEAAETKYAKALDAVKERHDKALEALTSKSARAVATVAARHAKALKGAQDEATDALADTAEAEDVADIARIVTVEEVLALVDARIDHGHADGRLAAVDVRNLIAEHFKEE